MLKLETVILDFNVSQYDAKRKVDAFGKRVYSKSQLQPEVLDIPFFTRPELEMDDFVPLRTYTTIDTPLRRYSDMELDGVLQWCLAHRGGGSASQTRQNAARYLV